MAASRGRTETRSTLLERSTSLRRDVVATTRITPAGGTIEIDGTGLFVVFPENAVAHDLIVTVKAHHGKEILYSFEPHGVQFSRPITIAQFLSYMTVRKTKGGARPEIHGGYLRRGVADVDALGTAEFAETFPTQYGAREKGAYVFFTTGHFSSYAMASGRSAADALLP